MTWQKCWLLIDDLIYLFTFMFGYIHPLPFIKCRFLLNIAGKIWDNVSTQLNITLKDQVIFLHIISWMVIAYYYFTRFLVCELGSHKVTNSPRIISGSVALLCSTKNFSVFQLDCFGFHTRKVCFVAPLIVLF